MSENFCSDETVFIWSRLNVSSLGFFDATDSKKDDRGKLTGRSVRIVGKMPFSGSPTWTH